MKYRRRVLLESARFVRLHDTWKTKSGGRVHIDVGCVSEKYRVNPDVPDTTHLMLDEDYAPDFVDFIKKMRARGR